MMCTDQDEVEKMLPSEQEQEEDKTEEEDEDDTGDEEEEEEHGADEEQEGGDAEEAPDKPEDAVQREEKKEAEGLNLNNEVVKMRKEVKRVRALIIRKLTRQIGALKKKKGKETEIERNTRRANRLLEEIHAMKSLVPDLVTKTALQKNLNFEQECKNPQSKISDRAVARIATHPQFSKKIEDIKAKVKAFKVERMKVRKPGGKEKARNEAGKATPGSPDKDVGGQGEKEEEGIKDKQEEIRHADGRDRIPEDTLDATSRAEPEKKTGKATSSADVAQRKEMPKTVKPASIKSGEVKDTVKNKPQSKDVEKKGSVPHKTTDEEQSDLESSDEEEKEYFDDSTEERFLKQSSQSEESDDDNDFFVGKVSKFKKKKKQKSAGGESVKTGQEVTADPVQSQLDELESRLKSKAASLHSVFCSSLSASKPGGGRGALRGRGGDKFRGQGKAKGGSGLNRDFSKQSRFQKQERRTETNSGSTHSKPESSERGFSSAGRGRGRGRGDVIRQKDHMGRGGVFSGQAPQQALHPSWEASKKRKEQQGQILAFQGKKIKFDDD